MLPLAALWRSRLNGQQLLHPVLKVSHPLNGRVIPDKLLVVTHCVQGESEAVLQDAVLHLQGL